MDFFQAQDKAKRKTGQLVLLFCAAVLGLIVLTNILLALTLGLAGPQINPGANPLTSPGLASIPFTQWITTSLAVLTVIGAATLYKYLQVRGGGRAVAEALGGTPLDPATSDSKQRRLQNIVEEMAIASGLPVPPVYLLDDPAINAFAAGLSPGDAVIGITQGTLDMLNREELQGVIGHEFSHILNGDMRINLRLIAILHGILFIGLIGQGLFRGRLYSGRSRDGGAPIIALAVGLLVIGYAGTFFGNLIKAAVSRQREFLADSASVQFTRNPDGLSHALQKIGGAVSGSTISRFNVNESSHMFFGQAVSLFMNNLTATHPPLGKRIKAIDPHWQGTFPEAGKLEGGGAENYFAPQTGKSANVNPAASGLANSSALDVVDLKNSVGNPTADNLETAQQLIKSSNAIWMHAAHDIWGARALVYTLLLDQSQDIQDAQWTILVDRADAGVPEYVRKLIETEADINQEQRLILLSASMPALKSLSFKQYKNFMGIVVDLIKIDERIQLFEWVMHRILVKDLKGHYERIKQIKTRHKKLEGVSHEVYELLAALARLSPNQQGSLASGLQEAALSVSGFTSTRNPADQVAMLDTPDPNFSTLNRALHELRRLHPLEKPRLIKACAATVLADGNINQNEMALLQGIAATLDCPLPPLFSK